MTTEPDGELKELSAAYREHLPDLTSPRFTTAASQSPYEYVEAFRRDHVPPWLYDLTQTWEQLLQEPFVGITVDGQVRPDLFHDEDHSHFAVQEVRRAACDLLTQFSDLQRSQVQYPVNAREWRAWSNPEFLLRPFGLRLEELEPASITNILHVIRLSFSKEGYDKIIYAMRINHFLGELCNLPRNMNQYSYNFLLFGNPSDTAATPWGWSLYGHHLCLNVFFPSHGNNNIIIAPTFIGAEPNLIDRGPWAGTQILHREGILGLRLMQSLPHDHRAKAQIYTRLHDASMRQTGDLKHDRWNKDDQRHLCGAFRDNRIVPYEGLCVAEMTPQQQLLILDIAEEFLLYYPASVRQRRKESIKQYIHETYFCWIGGFGDDDAFYYRLQSPVVIFEFDHHSGVFLTNTEPARFHTHTIVRMPNAGDYGQALRRAEDRVPC